MRIQIAEILTFLKKQDVKFLFNGDKSQYVETYAPLNQLKDKAMIWAREPSYIDKNELEKHRGLLLFIGNAVSGDFNCATIKTNDPHKTYFKVLNQFWKIQDYDQKSSGIATSAIVKTKRIGKNTSVGEGSFIDENVSIGCNVKILHNVIVQGNVTIGDNTLIQSGAIIGGCGFGHYREDNNIYVTVPHLGGVQIGKNVYIGNGTCICRGCLGDTIIEDNVKIDNLCHIAHNVIVKERTRIVAGAMIGGSCIIERDSWIGLGTLIKDGISVSENTYCGAGAVVTKEFPEKKVLVGVPAVILRERDMERDKD